MSKTSYVGVNNVAQQCKSIYVGVNNIARKVTKAYVGDSNGKARLWWDESGIVASDLAVGDIVKLIENGTPVEYIVVNQGIPKNSNLYDASCNGTWLLRKDCHSSRAWSTGNANTYASSTINTWLNGDFFNSLGNIEQSVIKQVKIPYCTGDVDAEINSGSNGLSTKVFLLSWYEVGWTGSYEYAPIDGASLSYFNNLGQVDAKRIAYLSGTATDWWLRTPHTQNFVNVWFVNIVGNWDYTSIIASKGIRPALILPFTAKFDKDTKILKG